MKFKPGDKVRILDGRNIYNYAGGWSQGMHEYVGCIYPIALCNEKDPERPSYYLEGLRWCWDERGLELVSINNESNIERVIFNDPATIVIWKDGTKTVVKCQEGDVYDAEKGLALCIAKKYLGNKGNFNEVFKKWVPEPVKAIHVNSSSNIRECEFTFTVDGSPFQRLLGKFTKEI